MNLLMVNDAVLAVDTMKKDIPWNEYGIDEVYIAYNVQEGMDMISTHPIDILLCDIEMPGKNGLCLIRWLREKNYDIDYILLTCHASFDYAHEAISLDCQDYLLIPCSYNKIGETVLKVVRRRMERISNSKLQEYGKSWLREKESQLGNSSGNSKKPREIAEECVDYIRNNLGSEELCVSNLAAHFYLNPIYLNRIFKKEMNTTLCQFIISEKMVLAAKLLKNTNHSVIAIANHVGYPNYAYFITTFKRHHNCTPSQYRAGEDTSLFFRPE